MKKLKYLLPLIIITLMLSSCGENKTNQNGNNSNQTLIMGLDENFPPMGFRDEKGELVGFDIDMANEVSNKIGMKIEFQPIDWDSKELELNSGKVDLLWNGLTITEERANNMLFTKPYLDNRQIILVKEDSAINAKNDLESKIIGLQKGSSSVEAVNKDNIKDKIGNLVEYADNISAFTDLNIGRIDAVVVDEIVARYYLANNDSKLRILEDNFGSEQYGVAVKLENTELNEKIQTALDEMQKDGTYSKISEKWFGEDLYSNK